MWFSNALQSPRTLFNLEGSSPTTSVSMYEKSYQRYWQSDTQNCHPSCAWQLHISSSSSTNMGVTERLTSFRRLVLPAYVVAKEGVVYPAPGCTPHGISRLCRTKSIVNTCFYHHGSESRRWHGECVGRRGRTEVAEWFGKQNDKEPASH